MKGHDMKCKERKGKAMTGKRTGQKEMEGQDRACKDKERAGKYNVRT